MFNNPSSALCFGHGCWVSVKIDKKVPVNDRWEYGTLLSKPFVPIIKRVDCRIVGN